ncbi:MAG TPA: M48 family metallopeptidase [Gemmataceae bacterium]|jgi:Zn-dependent protease with chaperone function
MPFLLMVFLVLVCLPEPEIWPKPFWTDSPLSCLTATWLMVLLTGLHAYFIARRVRRPLETDPSLREHLLIRYERDRFRHQLAVFVVFLVALLGLGWGWAVGQLWRGDGGSLSGAELLILSPFVVSQLLTWAAYYDAERAAHQAAHRLFAAAHAGFAHPHSDLVYSLPRPFRAGECGSGSDCGALAPPTNAENASEGPKAQSLPRVTPSPALKGWANEKNGADSIRTSHAGGWVELDNRPSAPAPFGSRASYVLFQLRQKLALVFLPVLLLLVQREIQRLFPENWQEWQKTVNFLGIASVLIVFAAMPWIVRLVLGLKPLPDGLLRQRLEASARRLRFRCSNILLWNTRNGMANAMVIGILPWVRYVVFTDRLLDDFTPDEIEAVFGHEIGHVRHHHMLYYFSFLTASVLVLGWLITDVVVSYLGPIPFALDSNSSDYVSAVSLVTVLLAYIFVVFGFLSRRCERQADVFGCRAVSCTSPDCGGHENEVEFAPRGQGLCPTGINTFIRALEKVAAVNGISRDRPGFLQSWQHASIGRRIEFLQQMLIDPTIERRFQRRVFLFKALLLLALGGAVALILSHESKTPASGPIGPETLRER